MSYPNSPGYKTSGPSADAARAIAPRAKSLRERVHQFLIGRFPVSFSADEIAEQLDETILSVRPRVSELNKLDLIEEAEIRTKNASGMTASRWRARVSAAQGDGR